MPPQAITIIYNKYWLKLLVTHFNCMLYLQKNNIPKSFKWKNHYLQNFCVLFLCIGMLICEKKLNDIHRQPNIQWDATFCRPFYSNHSTSGNILCKLILSPPLSHRQISLNHTSWGQGSLGLYNSCLIYLLCTVTQRYNNNESITYSIIVFVQDKSG